MMTKLQGSTGMGTKEDEPGTGHIWAAGFHRVNGSFSLGARFNTYEPFISLIFLIFFSSHCQPDTESMDTGVCLYMFQHC
jgi:hypothetical protein